MTTRYEIFLLRQSKGDFWSLLIKIHVIRIAKLSETAFLCSLKENLSTNNLNYFYWLKVIHNINNI